VKIELFLKDYNPVQYVKTITHSTSAVSGSFKFNVSVPATFSVGSYFKVAVTSLIDFGVVGVSAGAFRIVDP